MNNMTRQDFVLQSIGSEKLVKALQIAIDEIEARNDFEARSTFRDPVPLRPELAEAKELLKAIERAA